MAGHPPFIILLLSDVDPLGDHNVEPQLPRQGTHVVVEPLRAQARRRCGDVDIEPFALRPVGVQRVPGVPVLEPGVRLDRDDQDAALPARGLGGVQPGFDGVLGVGAAAIGLGGGNELRRDSAQLRRKLQTGVQGFHHVDFGLVRLVPLEVGLALRLAVLADQQVGQALVVVELAVLSPEVRDRVEVVVGLEQVVQQFSHACLRAQGRTELQHVEVRAVRIQLVGGVDPTELVEQVPVDVFAGAFPALGAARDPLFHERAGQVDRFQLGGVLQTGGLADGGDLRPEFAILVRGELLVGIGDDEGHVPRPFTRWETTYQYYIIKVV